MFFLPGMASPHDLKIYGSTFSHDSFPEQAITEQAILGLTTTPILLTPRELFTITPERGLAFGPQVYQEE